MVVARVALIYDTRNKTTKRNTTIRVGFFYRYTNLMKKQIVVLNYMIALKTKKLFLFTKYTQTIS